MEGCRKQKASAKAVSLTIKTIRTMKCFISLLTRFIPPVRPQRTEKWQRRSSPLLCETVHGAFRGGTTSKNSRVTQTAVVLPVLGEVNRAKFIPFLMLSDL